MIEVEIAKALGQVQAVGNVLRGHADLGDHLPPAVSRTLSEALQRAVNDLAAVASGKPAVLYQRVGTRAQAEGTPRE